MGFKSRKMNLSTLEGVYDVTVHKAAPGDRKMRWAKKSAPKPAETDSQKYDDARERMKAYGFDPNAPLPRGFFD